MYFTPSWFLLFFILFKVMSLSVAADILKDRPCEQLIKVFFFPINKLNNLHVKIETLDTISIVKAFAPRTDDSIYILYGMLKFTIHQGELQILSTIVDKEYRRIGVLTKMLEAVIASHPEVVSISGNLNGSNREVYAKTFNQLFLDRYPKYKNNCHPYAGDFEIYMKCLRPVILQLMSTHHEREIKQLARRALESTPAYRARAKLGFTTVDSGHFVPEYLIENLKMSKTLSDR